MSGGTTTSSISARGGDTTAIGATVDAAVASIQVSSANGSKPITSTAIAQMLRNLPTGDWNPFAQQIAPETTLPTLVDGTASGAGDSTAMGLRSTIAQTNTQIAVCKDPTVNCIAANLADLSIVKRDMPPTWPPSTSTGGPAPGRHRGARRLHRRAMRPPRRPPEKATLPTRMGTGPAAAARGGGRPPRPATPAPRSRQQLAPDGRIVLVDLWNQWPGRRLPPMPGQNSQSPYGSDVDVTFNLFPGAGELPLPEPAAQEAAASGPTRPVASSLTRRPSADVAAEADEEYPVLLIRDVETWGWPALQALPLPGQLLPAVAAPSAPVAEVPAILPAAAPPDAGVVSVDFGVAAVLSAAMGALAGLRRGRALALATLLAVVRPLTTIRLQLNPEFRQRGLGLLRLTLGILRLW